MNAQPIRHARASDGRDVPYWRAGSGPALLTSGVGHTRAASDFELPVFADFYRRLIERFQVVRFDDPSRLVGDGQSLDRWADYASAVARDAGLDRFALLAVWPHGSLNAAYLASQLPDRLTHLILWCPGLEVPEPVRVFGSLQREYPDLGRELRLYWAGFDDSVQRWARLHDAERMDVPSQDLASALDTLEARAERLGPLLGDINAPVLALYRPDALIDYGRGAHEFTAAIPGAVLVPVAGRGTSIVVEEQESIVAMIAAFIAEGAEEAAAIASPAGDLSSPLSQRELQVLQHVANGASNSAIAAELGRAESTIANHIRNILAKTGAANRAEAVHIATRLGLLDG